MLPYSMLHIVLILHNNLVKVSALRMLKVSGKISRTPFTITIIRWEGNTGWTDVDGTCGGRTVVDMGRCGCGRGATTIKGSFGGWTVSAWLQTVWWSSPIHVGSGLSSSTWFPIWLCKIFLMSVLVASKQMRWSNFCFLFAARRRFKTCAWSFFTLLISSGTVSSRVSSFEVPAKTTDRVKGMHFEKQRCHSHANSFGSSFLRNKDEAQRACAAIGRCSMPWFVLVCYALRQLEHSCPSKLTVLWNSVLPAWLFEIWWGVLWFIQ